MRPWTGAGRVRRCPGPRPGVPVAPAGPPRRRRRRRRGAARGPGPLPAGRRHRRRRRRRPLRWQRASGSLRSTDIDIVRPPWYHEPVELTTFCSGIGPRWAERRTIITGEHGALVDTAPCGSCRSWQRASARARRRLPHHLRGSRHAGAGSAVASCTAHRRPTPTCAPWPLRASDFDVLDHVNNARSLEAVEDELAPLPSRTRAARARIEYRGTVERGDPVELAGAVQSWRQRVGARDLAVGRRRGAGLGDRRRRIPRGEPGARTLTALWIPCLSNRSPGVGASSPADSVSSDPTSRWRWPRAAPHVTVIDSQRRAPRCQPRQPGPRRPGRHRARPSHRGGRGRPRRDRPARRPRRRGRCRRRVQPGRAGEPHRLDGRSAVRPRREHHEPVPLPRAVAAGEPVGDGRLHVDPPDLRQASLPPGRRGAPGRAGRRQRHHEVRDRAAAPPLPRRVRPRRERGAPDQRVRAPPAAARRPAGVPADLRAPRARRRADHGVRRRRAGARLPLRRRRGRVPAARRGRPRRRRGDLQRRQRRATVAGRDRRQPSLPPRAPVGSSTCPGRPTATPSTSGRTSATRRRRSGCWAGSRARRSPTASSARSRSTPNGDPGTCDRRRVTRHTPRSRRRSRPPRDSRSSPSSRTRSRASCGRARTCSVPSSTRSRPSSPRSPAGDTRSAWRREPTRSAFRSPRWASAPATR